MPPVSKGSMMRRRKHLLIFMIISLPFLLIAKQNSIEDVLLADDAYFSEIEKQYPEGFIDIFTTNLGRFATVYENSTYHFVVSTADYSSIKGYKGYSNLMVYIDQAGNVEDVTFIESQDTKPYVKKVLRTKILSELSNQNINLFERPSYLVTGATITSKVFNESVTQTLDVFREIFDQVEFSDSDVIVPDSLIIKNTEGRRKVCPMINTIKTYINKIKTQKNKEGGQIE